MTPVRGDNRIGMVHLNREENCFVWCSVKSPWDNDGDVSRDIDEVTCKACLLAAMRFSADVTIRFVRIVDVAE